MTGPVLVDTNVLIYARDSGATVKQAQAATWLDHLWRERLGRTSIQVLSEFYYNATHKLEPGLTPEDAWGYATRYLAWRPHPVDEPLLRRAREIEQRYRLNWWDSMIVAAAQLQDCALLLTEDLQDGAVFGSVTVRSPFTLEAREPTAIYAAALAAKPRHRSRGRPKRAKTVTGDG